MTPGPRALLKLLESEEGGLLTFRIYKVPPSRGRDLGRGKKEGGEIKVWYKK
jgi:hypothetical protein